jgi:hypothetical protein
LYGIPWPPRLNRPLAVKFNLAASTLAPGQSAFGAFPFGRRDGGGLWLATLTNINLRADDDVRAFRAVRMAAQGGVVPIFVPRNDTGLAPWPLDGDGKPIKSYGDIPFSDDSLFSDDTGFFQNVIDVVTVGASTLRQTTLPVQVNYGSALRGGECFSILHPVESWRMYEVVSIATAAGSSQLTLTIEPPLRDDVPIGTQLDFDNPRCTMRLAKPDSMDLDLTTYPYPRPAVDFVETFFAS